MFVGHGLVAFAVAASVAARRCWPADRALAVGVLAGLFGTLPDVDMVYAVVGLVGGIEGVFAASDAFWAAAHEVHRAVTHSLVVGTVAALGFAAWHARKDWRFGVTGVAVLTGVVAVGWSAGGPVAGAILTTFVLGGVGIVAAAEWFGFGTQTVLAAALLGLLSHPFGDFLTGTPPALLYPLAAVPAGERVVLHADPTLNLLGAVFVELATVWLALVLAARLRGWRLRRHVRPRAALGVGYAAAVFALPAPSVEFAAPFVFSILGVGALGIPVRVRDPKGTRLGMFVTALAAVTLAAVAYTLTYLAV